METPEVDVIIPVHTRTRPVLRAVQSVLNGSQAYVRVTVVAHNVPAADIAENLAVYADDPRLRLISLDDGIPSPSGPMNRGLAEATAPYVSLLGSDDEFGHGAVDSWLAIARETGASMVLARIDRLQTGTEPYPPVRPGRTRNLDPAKDRLAYRSAPLGLISRRHHANLRFTPGLHSGEDLEFTAALWFTGERIAYATDSPGYIVHEDETDRVTNAARSVTADFAFLDWIIAAPWFSGLPRRHRTALGVKILRLHYFDAVFHRLKSDEGIGAHRVELEAVLDRIDAIAPGSIALLARVERRIIDAVKSPSPDEDEILRLLAARWEGGPLGTLVTRNPLLSLHLQGPYRTLRATVPPPRRDPVNEPGSIDS